MSFERGEAVWDGNERILRSALVAALVAGLAAGAVYRFDGRIDAVSGVYGLDGVLAGWTVLLVHSLVVGAVFATVVVPTAMDGGVLAGVPKRFGPFTTSAVLGVGYGLLVWLVGVAVLVPLLVGMFAGGNLPIPYYSTYSLVAFLLFGIVLGVAFPVAYEALDGAERERADPL